MKRVQVSAIRCENYDSQVVQETVQKHLHAFAFFHDLKPESRVVIKPNLLMKRTPQEATTTHPEMVRAVVLALQKHGVHDIVIADSPGGPYTTRALNGIYKATGMAEVAQETGAKLNFDLGWKMRIYSSGVQCREFSLLDPILEADFIINLPKLKTHAMTGMSGSVKNLFGCIPGLQKPQLHFRFPQAENFSRMLLDLALLVRPSFTIVDAIESMEGDGPSGGELRQTGMTFAARDVFALDLALCDYMGMQPHEVWMVQKAIQSGLCPTSVQELEYLGDGKPKPENFMRPSSGTPRFSSRMPRIPSPLVRYMENALAPRPHIRHQDCIGCGKCAESCAPQAIIIRDHKAFLNRKQCIRCFCCHEMCPVRAVDIRHVKLLDR